MNATTELILWILLLLGIPSALAIVFLIFPHKIVQIQARFYKVVCYDVLGWTKDDVDAAYKLPTDRLSQVRQSEFIRIGMDNPKHFSELIAIYRFIGVLIGIFATLCLVSILIYLIS